MKIIKIAQNIQYLTSIGVPAENAQMILDFLKQLEGDNRKIAINTLRKNPNASFEDINNAINGASKLAYMKKTGVNPEIAEWAIDIDEKNSVWIATQASKWVANILNADIKSSDVDEVTNATLAWMKHNYSIRQQQKIGVQYLLSLLNPHIDYILDWARVENPNLSALSISEAKQASEDWHIELANKEVDESVEYTSHNSVFKFPDGWEIVKLSSGDCKAEGELMGHCVGGYGDDVEEGRTEIYSLRDQKNKPHVTLEMVIPEDPDYAITIEQIQGKGNEDPIPEYKQRIKEWFQYLQNSGREFNPFEAYSYDSISVEEIDTFMEKHEEYGIAVKIDGIGGSGASYAKDISSAYSSGQRNRYWHLSDATDVLDSLINYAIKVKEAKAFDEGVDIFQEEVQEEINDVLEQNLEYLPSYPNEDDYKTYAENEFGEETELFDEDSYNEAVENFEESEKYMLNDININQFNEHLLATWNPIYEQYKQDHPEEFQNTQLQTAKNKNIIKMAKNYSLSAHEIASYIDALNIYLENDKIKDKKIRNLIKNLPYSSKVKKHFSVEECKIVSESVAYAWKELTGKDIIEESKIDNHSNRLQGNYWMIKNGILLEGINHITIIKQNINLFETILGISSLVIHQQLSSPPEKLIKTVLVNGGMRMYINSEGTGFFQLTDKTYKEWGRAKIKALDLDNKVTRVIDPTSPYKGWKSGILVKL